MRMYCRIPGGLDGRLYCEDVLDYYFNSGIMFRPDVYACSPSRAPIVFNNFFQLSTFPATNSNGYIHKLDFNCFNRCVLGYVFAVK